MNNSAIVLFAEAWKTAPIRKEVPAMTIDLYDGRRRRWQVQRCQSRDRGRPRTAGGNNVFVMHSPFSSPMLCKVGGWDGSESASEMHDSGVGLQCVIVVFAVEATVPTCREEPSAELFHGLHSTYIVQQVSKQPSIT